MLAASGNVVSRRSIERGNYLLDSKALGSSECLAMVNHPYFGGTLLSLC